MKSSPRLTITPVNGGPPGVEIKLDGESVFVTFDEGFLKFPAEMLWRALQGSLQHGAEQLSRNLEQTAEVA